MLVVPANVHEDADVVEECRDLEEQTVPLTQPVFGAQLVEQPHSQGAHVLRMARIEAVALAEAGGTRHDLGAEILALAFARADEIEQQPRAQRRFGNENVRGLGLGEEFPVREQRRHEGLGLGQGQVAPIDQCLHVLGGELIDERQERLAGHAVERLVPGLRFEQVGGREPCVAAQGDEVGDLAQGQRPANVLDDVVDMSTQQPHAAARGCRATKPGSGACGSTRARTSPNGAAHPCGGTRGRRSLRRPRRARPRATPTLRETSVGPARRDTSAGSPRIRR